MVRSVRSRCALSAEPSVLRNRMSPRRTQINRKRKLQFEQFEQRLALSAQAVTSLLPELDIAAPAITQQAVTLQQAVSMQQEVTSEHAPAEAAELAELYGLDGAGQTIAVIDSGIAWDHYALGNGFGEGHKVVGGWDFAENDADPYDDGPAGFHGTHVAGIIGSSDSQFKGISPGADLVGLRVFGDNGEGDLKWVEQALQWVHEHKDDFANPITTVNLSLGTNWDPDSTPDWASLDDEFAQLEADGLFISVAAGNNFSRLGQVGLSYPAVSPHVVPVASHGADGLLSDFSQRDEGVLVAPGEMLRSTVPGHLFGGESDQFLASNGTSMAAPYVAGASALLRQANEFMGVDQVNQDLLYEQFRESADQIFDSMTGKYYYRLNLEAAINSVIHDYHADNQQFASNIGALNGGELLQGTIGRTDDVDHFRFNAQQSGQVTLRFEVTDQMAPLVEVAGNDMQFHGNAITFDVVAGQTYHFSVGTDAGLGHYRIHTELASSSEAIDWGRVISHEFHDVKIDGNSLFEMTTFRQGILTIEADVAEQTGSPLTFEVLDQNMNRVQSVVATGGQARLDVQASAGERFFLKATGNAESVDFRTTNLVSLDAGHLRVRGTHQSDNVFVNAQSRFAVHVNDVVYHFDASKIDNVTVEGYRGQDRVNVVLGTEDHQVVSARNGLFINNQDRGFLAIGFEDVNVVGGKGFNVATLHDSVGDDTLTTGINANGRRWTAFAGNHFRSQVSVMDQVHVISSRGNDQAFITGTQGNETFAMRGQHGHAWFGDSKLQFDHFESVFIDGAGGSDSANLHDTYRNDQFVLAPGIAHYTNVEFEVAVDNVDTINAYSRHGSDSVVMRDSEFNDQFTFRDQKATMQGGGYLSFAQGFAFVHAFANGGSDAALILDTHANDQFTVAADRTSMTTSGLKVFVHDFESTHVRSERGGFDQANVYGTSGNDHVDVGASHVRVNTSAGTEHQVWGVDQTQLNTLRGHDSAQLEGTENREQLRSGVDEIEFETTLQMLRMVNLTETHFNGNGGPDEVSLEDLGELDLLESLGDAARIHRGDQTITAEEFAFLEAQTVDDAIAQYDLDDVDFLYMLRGGWVSR